MGSIESTLLVVGNLTVDEVVSQSEKSVQAGGAALYTSVAAAKMGTSVRVVSNVGYDYPKEYLAEMVAAGLLTDRIRIVGDCLTTRFVLEYSDTERQLFLREKCRKIEPEDVQNLRAQLSHIAPVFNDVPRETVFTLSEKCGLLSLDPQGYVRSVAEGERILPLPWFETEILQKITVFKSSLEELHSICPCSTWMGMEKIKQSGPEAVIITEGSYGALMLTDSGRYGIPAFPSQPVDTTGAGDAFSGGFLAQYLNDQDAVWSASLGTALASFEIETRGCRIEASKGMILERAAWVHERIERL